MAAHGGRAGEKGGSAGGDGGGFGHLGYAASHVIIGGRTARGGARAHGARPRRARRCTWATSWGGRRFREQGKDISLIYFGQISDVPTEDLREISSLREAAL